MKLNCHPTCKPFPAIEQRAQDLTEPGGGAPPSHLPGPEPIRGPTEGVVQAHLWRWARWALLCLLLLQATWSLLEHGRDR